MIHLLFSYGTLQLEKVQLKSFGRILVGKADRLYHYKLGQLTINDPSVLEKSKKNIHPIALKSHNPNDYVDGIIFEITNQELKQADDYEVAAYKRVLEIFDSGLSAWIYVENVDVK